MLTVCDCGETKKLTGKPVAVVLPLLAYHWYYHCVLSSFRKDENSFRIFILDLVVGAIFRAEKTTVNAQQTSGSLDVLNSSRHFSLI